ncbi:hypothetical protein GGI43DRAFT_383481 [Trichoderma evansii]
MAPSMSTLMASANPCPNPHIPPIKFERKDLPGPRFPINGDGDDQILREERAIRAYKAQAANMTEVDQQNYIQLLKNRSFIVPTDAIDDPSQHPLYRDLMAIPSWPKYVMLKSIYAPEILSQKMMTNLEIDLQPVFGSLDMKDLTSTYDQGHLVKRKWEDDSETEDNKDIPRRIVKKQSPEFKPPEQTPITTTQTQRPRSDAQRIVVAKTSAVSARRARGISIGAAFSNQNALFKRRCDALEASVADLQRKVDAHHLNLVVLLTTILEKVGQSADDIDVIRSEMGF